MLSAKGAIHRFDHVGGFMTEIRTGTVASDPLGYLCARQIDHSWTIDPPKLLHRPLELRLGLGIHNPPKVLLYTMVLPYIIALQVEAADHGIYVLSKDSIGCQSTLISVTYHGHMGILGDSGLKQAKEPLPRACILSLHDYSSWKQIMTVGVDPHSKK